MKAEGEGIREILAARRGPGLQLSEAHQRHASWSHGGRWGRAGDDEHPALRSTRRAMEAGGFRTTRENVMALAYQRGYEIAREQGETAAARSIGDKLASIASGTFFRSRPEAGVVRRVRERAGPHGKTLEVRIRHA